jgi:hypothetical protein
LRDSGYIDYSSFGRRKTIASAMTIFGTRTIETAAFIILPCVQ